MNEVQDIDVVKIRANAHGGVRTIVYSVMFAALCFLPVGCRTPDPPLVLATTSSVFNTGLLDRLLPAYEQNVRVSAVGSGMALDLLARGDADVAIAHAPEQETAALATHRSWIYRKFLYNDFVIVGPTEAPAGVRGTTDAVAAMRRIATTHARFISRGDGSGTH